MHFNWATKKLIVGLLLSSFGLSSSAVALNTCSERLQALTQEVSEYAGGWGLAKYLFSFIYFQGNNFSKLDSIIRIAIQRRDCSESEKEELELLLARYEDIRDTREHYGSYYPFALGGITALGAIALMRFGADAGMLGFNNLIDLPGDDAPRDNFPGPGTGQTGSGGCATVQVLPRKVEKAAGLHNLGNSCFVNAVLQVIRHSEEMRHTIQRKFEAYSGQNSPEALFFGSLYRAVFMEETLSPEDLKFLMENYDFYLDSIESARERLGEIIKGQWHYNDEQRSADEMLGAIRQFLGLGAKIQKLLKPINGKAKIEASGQHNFEPAISLELLDASEDFQDIIDSYYVHPHFDAGATTREYNQLDRILPEIQAVTEISFIFPKRLYSDGSRYKKSKRRVKLTGDLSFNLPLLNMNQTAPKSLAKFLLQHMVLKSAIVHIGGANDGHYITIVYDPISKSFTLFNDSKVFANFDPVKARDLIETSATCLHFVRIEGALLTPATIDLKVRELKSAD